MKKMFLVMTVLALLSVGDIAQATDLGWQLRPIMGTSAGEFTNPTWNCTDVVVTTDTGNVYIPHYNIDSTNPYYNVGNINMNMFAANSTGAAVVYTGSGVYLNDAYGWMYEAWLTNDADLEEQRIWEKCFISEKSGDYAMTYNKIELNELAIGKWTYHENWYQVDNTITSNTRFEVTTAVPEPGTILAALSILSPAGIIFKRRKSA